MGHSSFDFRGAGFISKDWKVTVWLHLLVREADRMPAPPPWLVEARDHWQEQATLAINGCIDPSLDTFLTSDERVAVVCEMTQRALSALVQFGDRVPCDFLNGLCQVPPSRQWPQDVETELFLRPGRALLKLLHGKMTSHEFA
jgi:hypothetical protein